MFIEFVISVSSPDNFWITLNRGVRWRFVQEKDRISTRTPFVTSAEFVSNPRFCPASVINACAKSIYKSQQFRGLDPENNVNLEQNLSTDATEFDRSIIKYKSNESKSQLLIIIGEFVGLFVGGVGVGWDVVGVTVSPILVGWDVGAKVIVAKCGACVGELIGVNVGPIVLFFWLVF